MRGGYAPPAIAGSRITVAPRGPASRARRACGCPRRRRRRSRTGAGPRAQGSGTSGRRAARRRCRPTPGTSRSPPVAARSVGGIRTFVHAPSCRRCRDSRAELDVVDVLGDRRVLAADGAGRVAPERDLGERAASASKSSSRPTSGSPIPSASFSASVAWIEPITPGRTPSTPPSAQLGASSGGGGCGNRQR